MKALQIGGGFMPKSAKDILEKFGKSLDKHYGINDFGCRECDKLVDRALSSLRSMVMGMRKEVFYEPNDTVKKLSDTHIYNSAVETIANELFGNEL